MPRIQPNPFSKCPLLNPLLDYETIQVTMLMKALEEIGDSEPDLALLIEFRLEGMMREFEGIFQ